MSYDSFVTNTALALCGDDNTWTVSDAAVGFSNSSAVKHTMGELGVIAVTDTDEPRQADELGFLSARTVYLQGQAVPLYDSSKILTSLLYSEDSDDPVLTLTRACCLMQSGWTDIDLRRYLYAFISWLVEEYDQVLCESPEWKLAKAQVPTDRRMQKLFLGESFYRPMEKQSLSSGSVGIKTPTPTIIMTKTASQKARKAAARAAPAAMPAKLAQKKKPRFSAELGSGSFGPVNLQGLKFSSRNVRSDQTGMVGLGNKAINAQTVMPRIVSRKRNDGNVVDVLVGTDLVATVTSSEGANVAGDLLVTQIISPPRFPDTRQLQFSNLYQRYRYTRVSFLYEPIANATQSGQLLGFCDFDVADILETESADNLQIGAAHQGQNITQIWEPCRFDMRQTSTFTDLFVEDDGIDPRLSQQGVFYLMAASALPASIPLGNIYVSYEVEFSIPNLTVSAIGAPLNQWAVATVYSTATASGGYLYLPYSSFVANNSNGIIISNSGSSLLVSGLSPGLNYQVDIMGSTSPNGVAVSTDIANDTTYLLIGSSYTASGFWTGYNSVSAGGQLTFYSTSQQVVSGTSLTFEPALHDVGSFLSSYYATVGMQWYVRVFAKPAVSLLASRRRRRFGVLKEIDELKLKMDSQAQSLADQFSLLAKTKKESQTRSVEDWSRSPLPSSEGWLRSSAAPHHH